MVWLPDPVLTVLRRCRWVHELGMATACDGCANDGEDGYCMGAGVGPMQDGEDGAIYCHCGHRVVMVEWPRECDCSGPDGWHCPGEDSQHWAEFGRPGDPCGHCGGDPGEYDDSIAPLGGPA